LANSWTGEVYLKEVEKVVDKQALAVGRPLWRLERSVPHGEDFLAA
jgi:hypothetical protein